MKKLLMAAVAVSGLAASPAFASTDAVYTFTGTVNAVCSATASVTTNSALDTNGSLSTSQIDAAPDTGAYCNGAGTTVEVSHTAMKNTSVAAGLVTTPPTGFTGTITFTPEVTAGTTVLNDTAAGTALGAFSGLTVKAKSLSAGGMKLLAGSYSGTITVKLSPVT